MKQNDIEEIINYINEKYDENIPSLVKIFVRKKIGKLQSFPIESLPSCIKTCTVEDFITIVKDGIDSHKLKI